MSQYLLDTNICIYVINKRPPEIFERFKTMSPGELGISVITRAELDYGVAKSGSVKNRAALDKFLLPLTIYSFGEKASLQYANIRAHLESRGTPIGGMDMLIAAHARALNQVLVTNNTSEFERVPGLQVENWVRDSKN